MEFLPKKQLKAESFNIRDVEREFEDIVNGKRNAEQYITKLSNDVTQPEDFYVMYAVATMINDHLENKSRQQKKINLLQNISSLALISSELAVDDLGDIKIDKKTKVVELNLSNSVRKTFEERSVWPVPVPEDGTCQFHSVGLFLKEGGRWIDGPAISKKPMSGFILRKLVADYATVFLGMASNSHGDRYIEFLRSRLTSPPEKAAVSMEDEAEEIKRIGYEAYMAKNADYLDNALGLTVDEWVKKIGSDSSFFGDSFSLAIMSNMFFIDIHVFDYSGDSGTWNIFRPNEMALAEASRFYRRDIEVRHVHLVRSRSHYWPVINVTSPDYMKYSTMLYTGEEHEKNFGNPQVIDWRTTSILFLCSITAVSSPPHPPRRMFLVQY